VVRLLQKRGVRLARLEGEDSDGCRARIETALMALFRDTRSEAAFEALYDYASASLLQRVLVLARGEVDPLEVVQDAFVNVYLYAKSFRDDHARSFRVWSRTIAANLVRRARRRATASLQALPDGLQEPADARPDPGQGAVLTEERRALVLAWMLVLSRYAAAFEGLNARDRRALDLVEVRGLTYRDAARELGVGLSNMKMILFRARQRIRCAIGGDLARPEPTVALSA
jgi:RNA polymerase sigma-70 factor (ECF subfamily)